MPEQFNDGVRLGSTILKEDGGLLKTMADDEVTPVVKLDSASTAYTPVETLDWADADPDPDDVKHALDILAARTGLLGGGAQVIADTQAVSASDAIMTTSLIFVDVPGMALTTDNEGGSNTYVVMFNSEFELNTPNKIVSFRVMIGGVAEVDSLRNIDISSANSPSNGGTFSWKASVGDGVVIKVQWKVDSGTAKMRGRTLIIQGSE